MNTFTIALKKAGNRRYSSNKIQIDPIEDLKETKIFLKMILKIF